MRIFNKLVKQTLASFVAVAAIAACGPVPHPAPKTLLACAEVDIGTTIPEIAMTILGM
jgi:hypothetical protein